MAVLNIKEKWKTDPRRRMLAKRLGNDRLADGMLVEIAWLLIDHKGESIPLKDFKFVENFQDWIDCGLGEITDEVVLIEGSEIYKAYFEKQKVNGSKGGRPANPPKPNETQKNPPKPNDNPGKPFPFPSSFPFKKEINNSLKQTGTGNVNNSDPLSRARFCFESSDKFGRDDWLELKKLVGDELYEHVRKNFGWQTIRETKREQWAWAIPNLAKALANAPGP